MVNFDLAAWGFFAPKSKFDPAQIQDLSGKVVIVTGANTGIGKETAKQLLSKNAKVYAACRSQDKAESAIREIKSATGKSDIHYLKLDLGDIKQAVSAATEFLSKESRLDILINSAGVMFPPDGSKTKDGYEMQFGTNTIGHYAFTSRLIPLLLKTAKMSPPASVRVIWVASSGHFVFTPKSGINYDSIKNVSKVDNQVHYGQSKLATIHLANEMAQRYKDDGILSVSLHPGNIASDLQRHTSRLSRAASPLLLAPVPKGALTQLYAATSPDLTMADSGAYFVPWARKHHPSHPKANDKEAQLETWNYCEDAVSEALRK